MMSKEMDILASKLIKKSNSHKEPMVALVLMAIAVAIAETEQEIVKKELEG